MELTSNDQFHRIFWSPSVAATWMNYQKHLFSVDGAFLPSSCGGTLLTLTSEDSEKRSVILAIAITVNAGNI